MDAKQIGDMRLIDAAFDHPFELTKLIFGQVINLKFFDCLYHASLIHIQASVSVVRVGNSTKMYPMPHISAMNEAA